MKLPSQCFNFTLGALARCMNDQIADTITEPEIVRPLLSFHAFLPDGKTASETGSSATLRW